MDLAFGITMQDRSRADESNAGDDALYDARSFCQLWGGVND